MAIEPEDMTVKLLGIGERKTSYHCEYCGKWTDGITSHKGFICCKECKKERQKMSYMIKDLKKMATGTEIRGFPLMIKTARKAFRDADGAYFQEVVFMDASGEMTGHILLETDGEEPQKGHHTGPAAFTLWKSKTNICIMNGVLQDTDERRKEATKLVIYECFDAATPLSYDQGQDLQAEEWRQIREDEIRGKVRHWVSCSYIQTWPSDESFVGPSNSIKQEINEWTDFIITGE